MLTTLAPSVTASFTAVPKSVKLVEVSAEKYYGAGYQDVRARRPWINNTVEELGWKPEVDMPTALKRVFESYKADIKEARALVEAS